MKLKQGETDRLDCESCGREFEVTLEPKMKDKSAEEKEKAGDTAALQCCPFCASESIISQNDPDPKDDDDGDDDGDDSDLVIEDDDDSDLDDSDLDSDVDESEDSDLEEAPDEKEEVQKAAERGFKDVQAPKKKEPEGKKDKPKDKDKKDGKGKSKKK